jgi:hypothetical protein
VREYGRALLGDVFVEKDARLGVAEQLRRRRLTVVDWPIAQVLAVMLDRVES